MSGSDRFYLPQLDGLRFLAFAMVFFRHVMEGTRLAHHPWGQAAIDAGALGVDLFFALSSLLITTLLLRERAQRGDLAVRAFWARRILRIWPLYYALVVIGGLVERPVWQYTAALCFFVLNWSSLTGGYPYSTGILWSVSIEEQFYLLWPLIVSVMPRNRLAALCFGLVGIALASRWLITVHYADLPYSVIWCNTLARLDPIAMGALVALAPNRLRLSRRGRSVSLVVGLTLLIGLQRWWSFFDHPHASDIWAYLVVGLVVGGMVLAVIAAPAGLLGSPALVYLGRISYGLYAWHLPMIRWTAGLGPRWWPLRVPFFFAVTVGIASLSYRFLERPFLQVKKRFTYVSSAPV